MCANGGLGARDSKKDKDHGINDEAHYRDVRGPRSASSWPENQIERGMVSTHGCGPG